MKINSYVVKFYHKGKSYEYHFQEDCTNNVENESLNDDDYEGLVWGAIREALDEDNVTKDGYATDISLYSDITKNAIAYFPSLPLKSDSEKLEEHYREINLKK